VSVVVPTQPTARSRFLTAVSWTGGSTAFNQAVICVRSLIIARLLTTTDYGLFGMATLVMHGMTVLTEFNLTSVVYTLKYESVEVRDRHLNTAWTADLIRRAAVSAILFAVSYPVSYIFATNESFRFLWRRQ
jgi:O-antigen/teichoic acid export membrane protein